MLFEFNDINTPDAIDLSYLNIPLNTEQNGLSNDLFNSKEGFERGNMFIKEYKQYKNYVAPSLKTDNLKEELTLKLYEYDFALNDLNLYLDLHPEDERMFRIFKNYLQQFENIKKEYIQKYGPLCLTDVVFSSYNWLDKFPWEKGGSINV